MLHKNRRPVADCRWPHIAKTHEKHPRSWDMTISAAAICRHGEKDCVIAVADRMLYAGSIEYEPDKPKIKSLSTTIICLFAGDATTHHMLANKTSQEIEKTKSLW